MRDDSLGSEQVVFVVVERHALRLDSCSLVLIHCNQARKGLLFKSRFPQVW